LTLADVAVEGEDDAVASAQLAEEAAGLAQRTVALDVPLAGMHGHPEVRQQAPLPDVQQVLQTISKQW